MTEKNVIMTDIVRIVPTINAVIVRNLVAIGVSTRDCGEEKSMEPPYEDYCYECGGYGDDYYIDDDGELKCRCLECSYNDWEDDDEDW